jgi:hypothetical protein
MQTLSTTSSTIFNPTKISSLSYWLDAADKSTITHTSNAVSQWNDKSTNAWHLTQATNANRPTTNTVTKNGFNVLSFDGTNDIMTNTSNNLFANIDGWGVFIVAQVLNTSACRIWGKYNPTGAGTNITRSAIQSNRAFNYYNTLLRRVDTETQSVGTATTNTGNWNIVTQLGNFVNGTNILRTNKVQSVSVAATTGLSTNSTGGPIAAGARGDSLEFMQGYIAEVVCYSKILTATEINLVESYLSSKWAI